VPCIPPVQRTNTTYVRGMRMLPATNMFD
jgi:hypothetical protein